MEASSSPSLYRRRAPDLSSGDCWQRSLAHHAVAVIPLGRAAGSAYCQDVACQTGSRSSDKSKPETSREKDDHIGVLCRYFYDGDEQHAAGDHLNGRVQSIAHRQSIRSCPEKLVSDKACNFHRQAHSEMPRDGAASFQINGRADAAADANQKATALPDLLLVSAIRRATSLPSQNSSQISRSCAAKLG